MLLKNVPLQLHLQRKFVSMFICSFITFFLKLSLITMYIKRKSRHLLETAQALLFQMNVPKHSWADVVSTTFFFTNRMPSSVLNWATPYHWLLPNNSLFPIDPKVFRCTCFVRDVCP